jgi:hypothetical protein
MICMVVLRLGLVGVGASQVSQQHGLLGLRGEPGPHALDLGVVGRAEALGVDLVPGLMLDLSA